MVEAKLQVMLLVEDLSKEATKLVVTGIQPVLEPENPLMNLEVFHRDYCN
jgi:hypothetical protein